MPVLHKSTNLTWYEWRNHSNYQTNNKIKTVININASCCLSMGFPLLIIYKLRIMYTLEWRTVSVPTRGLLLCLFPELWSNEENKYKNNACVSTVTVCNKSTYITLFLTQNNESIINDKIMIFAHRPRVSLAQSLFHWWRHNRLLKTSQLWDNCGVMTWIVISNLLDIDLIHGDIHGWSCKNWWFVICNDQDELMQLELQNDTKYII